MKLFHYYEKEIGPFINLSDLKIEEAENIMNNIHSNKKLFASNRDKTYLKRRFEYEDIVKNLFISKGGRVNRIRPHYMTLQECPWLLTWYKNGKSISIDIKDIDTNYISFTYGDMFPVFGPKGDDSKEYRKKVYTYEEILNIINKYGLPQNWNPKGEKGPIRYIEAQIWDNNIINIIKIKSGL